MKRATYITRSVDVAGPKPQPMVDARDGARSGSSSQSLSCH